LKKKNAKGKGWSIGQSANLPGRAPFKKKRFRAEGPMGKRKMLEGMWGTMGKDLVEGNPCGSKKTVGKNERRTNGHPKRH